MTEMEIYRWLLTGWFALSAITFIVLFFIPAPYGRYARPGWGLQVSARNGWILMEAAAVFTFAVFFLLGQSIKTPTALLFLLLWQSHYIYRAFVFPFRLRSRVNSMSMVVVVSGIFFNIVNGYLNGRWLFKLSPDYSAAWLNNPRLIIGTHGSGAEPIISNNSSLVHFLRIRR